MSIGATTQAWATIEVMLDLCNVPISKRFGEVDRFPLSLSRKIVLFRRGHNQLAELDALKAKGAGLADMIADANDRRNDLVHGMAALSLNEDIVSLVRHSVPRAPALRHKLVREIKTYSQSEIADVADEAMDLVLAVTIHAGEVIKTLLAHRADDEVEEMTRYLGI